MPLGRMLLKAISDSKKLSDLHTDGARLLYTWLIPHLDVNGCFSADPDVVRGHIFTRLKKKTSDISAYMDDLDRVGLIVRYKANGDIFLHVPDFKEKQPMLHPEREAKPTIPTPLPDQIIPYSGPTQDEVRTSSDTNQIKDKVNQGKLSNGRIQSEFDPLFDQFWSGYPKKVAKEVAREKFMILARAGKIPELIKATRGYMDHLKAERIQRNFVKEPMHPATFLSKDRWRDFVDFEYKPSL